MARILFNDLILFRQRSGIGQYAAQLLEQLPQAAPDLEIVRLSSLPTVETVARLVARGGGASSGVSEAGLLSGVKTAAQALVDVYLGALASQGHWDLLHEPDAIAFPTRVPTLLSIHDLSVLLYPELHPDHRVKRYGRYFMRSLQRGAHFVAVSQATRDAMVQHLKVEAHRISVIRQAPRAGFVPGPAKDWSKVKKARGLPDSYFLFVGTLEPRKNVAGLLRAYSRLSGALRQKFPLVLVGGWGWKSQEVREMLARSPWKENVKHLGFLPDADLIAVVQSATCLVFPSLYEGFGLPPLEAMACGTPVISSAAGGLAEAIGNAARIVDSQDDLALATAMKEVAESPELRAELSQKGLAHAAGFSWGKTARETAEVYRRILQGENSK